MIKSTELREGNLLYDCVKNIGSVVIGLGKFELATRQRGFVSIEECAPIPLTPEILEKAGFGIKEPSGTFAWKFSPAGETISVKCEYLHQLQNLYFALTGTELEIEL